MGYNDPPKPDGSDTTPPSTTSTPSSTTSSTSSPSSSSSTGTTLAERKMMAQLRASYLEILRRWGIPTSKNLLNLVEQAVRGQWRSGYFISLLRETPEYHQQFPGLKWRQGMSEAQYNSLFAKYKSRAQDIGLGLGRKQFAKMLRRGVEFDEFSDRVDALDAIRQYEPMWKQFQQVLELRGVRVPGEKLTKKELQKFVMGLGDPKWEKIYEETIVTTNLEKVAGIEVIAKRAGEVATPDAYGITRKDMLHIIKQAEALTPGFEVEDITSQQWADIGTRIREFSINYLNRYGLTTKDLLEMELGGPNAADIAKRAEQIIETQKAFGEQQPAIPQSAMQVGNPQEQELPQSL